MNDYITQLASLHWLDLLTAVGVIVVGSVGIKEALVKFCDSFDIQFGFIKERKEMKECQDTVKKELKNLSDRQTIFEKEHKRNIEVRDAFNKEVMGCITELKNDISNLSQEMERREAEKKFEKLRDDIIKAANELSTKSQVSGEYISYIYGKINTYESIHEKYGFTNNQAPASIAAITAKYQEMLARGQIIVGDD